MTEDTRYPYTYACDLIRSVAGHNADGTKLSRSDASEIRELFSSVLGIGDEELAKKLADYYLENDEAISRKSAEAFLKATAAGSVRVN